jgi:hypothetical protein
VGGIPPRPSKNRGRSRRLLVQSRAKQNTLSFLEEFFSGARKSEIVKSILLGGERQRAAGRLPLVRDF